MGLVQKLSDRIREGVWNWLIEGRESMVLTQQQRVTQNSVVTARNYYDGDHDVKLTERQKEFLQRHGENTEFNVNNCKPVVEAVVERLRVSSFDVTPEMEDEGSQTAADEIGKLIQKRWRQNRMDALQIETYRRAGRDGETFILVNWDSINSRYEFILHPRYTDTTVGGDGYGMWMEYPNDDHLLPPLRAVKQWKEKDEDGNTLLRRTIYYPDRIEKYVRKGGDWAEFSEEGEEWPIPWKDKQGRPLGIPVAHFKNTNLESDLKDVIPLQNLLNKTWVDLVAAADTTAFRMLIFLGWVPTTDGKDPESDGSNLLKLMPGQNVGTQKNAGQADVKIVDPAPLTELLNAEDRIIHRMASISRTSSSRFTFTRQVAAEDTLKQQGEPEIARAEEKQTLFGNAWEDAHLIGLKLEQRFGGAEFDLEDVSVSTVWQSAAIRDEKREMEIAEKKRTVLGIPREQLQKEAGYDDAQIEEFKKSPEVKAYMAQLEMTINDRNALAEARAA